MTKKGCVYLLWAEGTDRYKIGETTNLANRVSQLQTGCPYKLQVIGFKEVINHKFVEGGLKARFKDFRVQGEYFAFPPAVLLEVLPEFNVAEYIPKIQFQKLDALWTQKAINLALSAANLISLRLKKRLISHMVEGSNRTLNLALDAYQERCEQLKDMTYEDALEMSKNAEIEHKKAAENYRIILNGWIDELTHLDFETILPKFR